MYSSLEVPNNSSPVFSAEGQTHAIHRIGNVDFKLPSGEIKSIKDVPYVPGLHKNLLSTNQIVDREHMIVFDTDKCVVISKFSPSEIIASGARDKRSGLYNLSSYPSILRPTLLRISRVSQRMWYARLGHISYPSLCDLTSMSTGIPAFNKTKTCVCEICENASEPS